jgi:hypothetical protein
MEGDEPMTMNCGSMAGLPYNEGIDDVRDVVEREVLGKML